MKTDATIYTKEHSAVLDRMRAEGRSWGRSDLAADEKEAVDAWCRKHDHEMKHYDKNVIVCPHCLDEDHEVFDYPSGLSQDGDETETECVACGKPFTVSLNVSYTYTTRVPDEEDDIA